MLDEEGLLADFAYVSMPQATLEWENQEDGFLAKILVGDGSKDIPVGTPVAVITEDKNDVSLNMKCMLWHVMCKAGLQADQRTL